MRLNPLSGHIGRILLMVLLILLMTASMFAIAAVFMAYDPDAYHITRRWLHDSRWGLFAWRLVLYGCLITAWILKVRPQALIRWPDGRPRLVRMELMGVLFLVATEYVAWTSAV